MRILAALVMMVAALATPAAAQELPVGADQSIDMATLVRMLGPVLQSLGAGQSASLDTLKLNSQVGVGDIKQFSEIFKSLGFDGEMNNLLSKLEGLKNLDSGAIQQLVGSQSGLAGQLNLPGTAGTLEPVKAAGTSALSALATPAAAASPAPATVSSPVLPSVPTAIYRSTDSVDGKKLPRYSNLPPASGSYQVVERSH